MKKRFFAICALAYLLFAAFSPITFADPGNAAATTPCAPSDEQIANSTVKDMLANCQPTKGVIVSKDGDYTIEDGAREKFTDIANQIILVGSILSVGALVYAAILYTIAAGDDEQIKKAKGSLKFGIIGFVMMLLSFPLVNAIIRLFYSAAS